MVFRNILLHLSHVIRYILHLFLVEICLLLVLHGLFLVVTATTFWEVLIIIFKVEVVSIMLHWLILVLQIICLVNKWSFNFLAINAWTHIPSWGSCLAIVDVWGLSVALHVVVWSGFYSRPRLLVILIHQVELIQLHLLLAYILLLLVWIRVYKFSINKLCGVLILLLILGNFKVLMVWFHFIYCYLNKINQKTNVD